MRNKMEVFFVSRIKILREAFYQILHPINIQLLIFFILFQNENKKTCQIIFVSQNTFLFRMVEYIQQKNRIFFSCSAIGNVSCYLYSSSKNFISELLEAYVGHLSDRLWFEQGKYFFCFLSHGESMLNIFGSQNSGSLSNMDKKIENLFGIG